MITSILRKFLKLFFKKSKSQNEIADFSSPKRQTFSLPYNYMLYIADNRISPKAVEKLQQTCKYFFARQKILIIDTFLFKNEWPFLSHQYSLLKKCWKTEEDDIPPHSKTYSTQAIFSLKKLPRNVSFWLTNDFQYCSGLETKQIPFKLPKIYHISLKALTLEFQNLSKIYFEILTASGKLEYLSLYFVSITDIRNDKTVTWLEIYEKMPFLSHFKYKNADEITTVETIMKMHTIEHKVKLKKFYLDLIVSSPFTDIIYLWQFMKDNTCTAWMKKKYIWDFYPDFKFTFRNTILKTNWDLGGTPSFEYVIMLAVPDPQIIPRYDEREFYQNGIIKQLN